MRKCPDAAASLLEEESAIGGDGRMLAENMVERRHVGAFGVAALHRLFELPRVAQEHDAVCRLRDRQDVRQRHLCGLVDEQHIDGLPRVGAGPQPSCAAGDVASRCRSPESSVVVVGRELQPGTLAVPFRTLSGCSGSATPISAAGFNHFIEEVADDLVAVGCDADLLARRDQSANHARAGVSLSRSRRPLNGKHAAVNAGAMRIAAASVVSSSSP